jgi:hypothetical protein
LRLPAKDARSTPRGSAQKRGNPPSSSIPSPAAQLETPPPKVEPPLTAISPPWVDRLLDTDPTGFLISPQGSLLFNGLCLAQLATGKSLTEPGLHLSLDEAEAALGERGPIDRREQVEEHLRSVVLAKLGNLLNPLRFEGDEFPRSARPLLKDLSAQLSETLGSRRLHPVQGLLRALPGEARAALQARGIVVGRRHVFLRENLTPAKIVLRLALLVSSKGLTAPEQWKPSQVLILSPESGLSHLSGADCERLGYELFGRNAVRVDIVERVVNPSFAQNQPDYLPSLMHTFRCAEDEARDVARRLGLSGAKGRSSTPNKTGAPKKSPLRKGASSSKTSGGRSAPRSRGPGPKKRSR